MSVYSIATVSALRSTSSQRIGERLADPHAGREHPPAQVRQFLPDGHRVAVENVGWKHHQRRRTLSAASQPAIS